MAEEVTQGIADSATEQTATQAQEQASTNSTPVDTGTVQTGIADPEPSPSNTGIADSQASMQEQSKAQEAPVYEYELQANEGEELGFYQNACKKYKLSKVQAEGLLNDIREQNVKDIRAQQDEQMANARATINAWQTEINNDPDFGGKAWATTCNNARRAFDTFDEDGAIQKMLRDTGYQHNPKIIRAIAKIGASMGEDKYIGSNGKRGSNDELSLAERMYPGMK